MSAAAQEYQTHSDNGETREDNVDGDDDVRQNGNEMGKMWGLCVIEINEWSTHKLSSNHVTIHK